MATCGGRAEDSRSSLTCADGLSVSAPAGSAALALKDQPLVPQRQWLKA
jgi:hypothetical protein